MLTHGTTSGYYSQGCRCDLCRKAATDYTREHRHRTGVNRPRAVYLTALREFNPQRGPEVITSQHGYLLRWAPDHPEAMSGRVYEHRLVAEQTIGRRLLSGEQVHHINGDKQDNRPENLAVVDIREHPTLHAGATCGKGHPLVAENIYFRPDNGRRTCLVCRKAQSLRWTAKRSALRAAARG